MHADIQDALELGHRWDATQRFSLGSRSWTFHGTRWWILCCLIIPSLTPPQTPFRMHYRIEQSLLFEVGEAYREIVEIKASSGWPHRKVARAGQTAVDAVSRGQTPFLRLFCHELSRNPRMRA